MTDTHTDNAWQQWFEAIWADREENLYRQFFTDLGPGIYNLTPKTFQQLGNENPDPRWLFHGVFECPPTAARPHWLYVSSGMSNPWGDSPDSIQPDAYSGLGFEFTLHTNQRGRWAIELLHWLMAIQLLVAAGEMQGSDRDGAGEGGGGGLIEYHDRLQFRTPPNNSPADITRLLILPPEPSLNYPAQFQLASGKVDLMLLLAISEREANFAKTQNTDALLTLLRHRDFFPLTDLTRLSTL